MTHVIDVADGGWKLPQRRECHAAEDGGGSEREGRVGQRQQRNGGPNAPKAVSAKKEL